MAAGADKVVPWFSGWACLWPTGQRAASIEPRRPTMIGSDFGSAEGHFPFASTVPGNHRAGPCDPGGALYGRTECGRPRCARGRIPGAWEKGVDRGKLTLVVFFLLLKRLTMLHSCRCRCMSSGISSSCKLPLMFDSCGGHRLHGSRQLTLKYTAVDDCSSARD